MEITQKNKILYLGFLISVILLNVLPLRSFFQNLGLRWLYLLICSATLSFAFTPVSRALALKIGATDTPNERKVHKTPTPLFGGLAIYLAFIGSIVSNFIFTEGLLPILVSGTIIIVIGIIDDIKEAPASIKLVFQIIACLIVILSGISLGLFPKSTLPGQVANGLLTALWLVGITNAMNFFDGMDGLATGISGIIAFFLSVIAFQTNQVTLGWISISIVGACIGFFPFNFHLKKSATIFLGDAGSTFLGFILACLAVKGNWSEDNPIVSISAPLLIFSVLIFDMTYITIFRIKSGKVTNFKEWIDYVGKDHFHHRLESLLKSKRWSVLFIFLITICLSLNAIVLKHVASVEAVLLILQAAFIVTIISILERSGRKQERRKKD